MEPPVRSQQFWGKASPAFPGPRWHPLPLHALDVAAVGAALLTEPRSPASGLGSLLGWARLGTHAFLVVRRFEPSRG